MNESTVEQLLVTKNPVKDHWELKPVPVDSAFNVLIGWVTQRAEADEGVPEIVKLILCQALCSTFQVLFLRTIAETPKKSHKWSEFGSGQRMMLKRKYFSFPNFSLQFPLYVTSSDREAMGLFSDDRFDWHLRSQIVLLLNHEQNNPQIEYSALHRLWSDQTDGEISSFKIGLPIAGFMAPGVDGDFAQIVIFDKQASTRLFESFAEICDQYHIPLSEVDEEAFETTSWFLYSE